MKCPDCGKPAKLNERGNLFHEQYRDAETCFEDRHNPKGTIEWQMASRLHDLIEAQDENEPVSVTIVLRSGLTFRGYVTGISGSLVATLCEEQYEYYPEWTVDIAEIAAIYQPTFEGTTEDATTTTRTS